MNFKKALCGKGRLSVVAFFLLISLALLLLWFSNSNSSQALPSLVADVYFEGRWRIGDGEWHELAEGEHIPSTEGDVTLQGNFHELDPGGGYVGIYRGELPIAFFLDHVSATVYEVGQEPFVLDTENPLYGDSVCGVRWEAYLLTGESSEPIEIVIHNPHGFGNERAIDEMLSELALWNGMEFENRISDRGEPERNAGMLLMLVSVVFLGIALFSSRAATDCASLPISSTPSCASCVEQPPILSWKCVKQTFIHKTLHLKERDAHLYAHGLAFIAS